MRTRALRPFALSVLLLTAASCGGDDDSEATAETSAITEATVAATDMAVEIADFAFGPAGITIAVGGTVTWTNTDNQAHTATSSGNFDTGSIDPAATASVTFDESGTFTYICSFHPFMTGTITVV